MRRLWTVESGEYSDHVIYAVFEDRATAEAWADELRKGESGHARDAEVKRMLLVPAGVVPHQITTYHIYAAVEPGGSIRGKRVHADTSLAIETTTGLPLAAARARCVRRNRHGWDLYVKAASLEDAERKLAERVEALKEGPWGAGEVDADGVPNGEDF